MAGQNFVLVLEVALFLFTVYSTGRLFRFFKAPVILGQLAAGILMGPKLLDMVPYASDGYCDTPFNDVGGADGSRLLAAAGGYSCDHFPWMRWDNSMQVTSIWTFVGNCGVTLMIFESGMHICFDKVAQVGVKATIVAIFGTFLPMGTGMLLVGLMFGEFYPSGFAAGCAFAPTSVGISIKLLDESKMLNSLAGQTTLTAAFIDDVFSLVTLVMMQSLAKGNVGPKEIIVPTVCSFLFLGGCVFCALYVFNHLHAVLARFEPKEGSPIQPRDEAHLMIMMATLLLCGWITSIEGFIGSHLLGAFGAGMMFVNVPRSHAIWTSQMKRIVRWMVRIFFACSVGFAVPVDKMFSLDAFLKGLALGVGPTIATKMISGLFAHITYASEEARKRSQAASWVTKYVQPQQLLVGMAMVARGEFAYMVAETAQGADYAGGEPGAKMMSQEVYASVVWALVMATIASPVMFRWAIGVFARATPSYRSKTIGGTGPTSSDPVPNKDSTVSNHQGKSFTIRVAARHKPGVQREMLGALHSAGLDVLQVQVYAVEHGSTTREVGAFVASYVVLPRGKGKDYDDEKLEEIHHHLMEVLDDEDSQIMFEPYDDDFTKDGVVEIQVHVTYHPDILHEITDELAKMGLTVMKAECDHSAQPVRGHTLAGGEHSEPVMIRTDPTQSTSSKMDPQSPKSPHRPQLTEDNLVSEASARALGALQATGGGAAFFALQEASREIFYVKEADNSHQFSHWRRAEIQGRVEQIIHNHELKGTVIVRILHQHEMKVSKVVPKIDKEERVVVLKMSGTHHVDLLHQICDSLYEAGLDVLHSELDTNEQGKQEHIMYVEPSDGMTMSAEQRLKLRRTMEGLYSKHGRDGYHISVRPMTGGSTGGDDNGGLSRKISPESWANIPMPPQPIIESKAHETWNTEDQQDDPLKNLEAII
jgi:Kef-type K+ transport system membrane component KefB/glycine cleavage system regulatory protein